MKCKSFTCITVCTIVAYTHHITACPHVLFLSGKSYVNLAIAAKPSCHMFRSCEMKGLGAWLLLHHRKCFQSPLKP